MFFFCNTLLIGDIKIGQAEGLFLTLNGMVVTQSF
jgi:hypothetical protein